MKYNILLTVIILSAINIYSQNTLTGIVTDSLTKQPVPFANIVIENSIKGTVSGFDGAFSLNRKNSETSFKISCIGYENKIVVADISVRFIQIKLVPKQYELSQVMVYPGENPALTIMKKVYENRDKNNPDVASDYKCLLYHKMTFGYDEGFLNKMSVKLDSAYTAKFLESPQDTTLKKKYDEEKKDLEMTHNIGVLIESASEKKHIAPDKDNERIISGRTSGFRDPLLSSLPAQLQSFTFYKDYVSLLSNNYMSPVSKAGLQRYFFNIEDTLLNDKGDTLYYISFRPHKNANIKGMTGSAHVHIPTYGFSTVNATVKDQVGDIKFDFSVKQTYQYIDDKQWFPEHLESLLEYKISSRQMSVPMVAKSKSTVTAIQLNPELSKKEFSAITLIDETNKYNQPIDNYRIMPLTAQDSAIYNLMDSIFMEHKIDKILLNFTKSLFVDGGIPIGPFNIDLGKTINYNEYDGLMLGLGLWTNEKVIRFLSVGGFYYYSFKSEDHNYGAGLKFKINRKTDTNFHFQWEKRNMETGKIVFIDGTSFLYGDLSGFFTKIKEPTNSLNFAFSTRFLDYFKTNIYYNYSKVSPQKPYPFIKEDVSSPPLWEGAGISPFLFNEYGLKLKWANKETFTYMFPFGLMSNGTNWPVVWTNFAYGNGTENNVIASGTKQFEYKKLEAQIEKCFRIYEAFRSTVRVTGGNIWGKVPVSKLYTPFGMKIGKYYNLEIPHYFAVMRPNEFATSKFVNISLANTYYMRLNSSKKFKPEITVLTSAGWGDVSKETLHATSVYSIKTYNKGYYESGIYFGNLIKSQLYKLGIGIHYRYGPYRFQKRIDNWAFTIGFGFM